MPGKRKPVEQTNVTPVKKKRETIASTKKRVRDTGVEATVRKTARKTKKEQELEEDSNNAEEEEQEPTKTPKRNSKLEKTASSRTVESTAPKLGRSTRKSVPIKNASPEAVEETKDRTAKAVPSSSVLLQSTGLNPATLDGALFTDEAEIIDIWNQCWSALYLCISTIGPIFLAVILIAYLSSKMTASQMIASVGVVFTYVFLLIMVGYTVAIVPFVLISRIFTSLVAPQNGVETEELNTYCRLLTLVVTLLCGVGYFAASSA